MEDPEERERKLESYVMEASKGITLAMELGRPTERTAGSLGTTQSSRGIRGATGAVTESRPTTMQRVLALLKAYDEKASAP